MDCFGTYFTHVQICDVTHAQSATEWTASVHASRLLKVVMLSFPSSAHVTLFILLPSYQHYHIVLSILLCKILMFYMYFMVKKASATHRPKSSPPRGGDRRTIVKVTVDNYGPPQVPTPPAVPLPPEVPSNSSSSTTTDPSTSTRKRPLEATWLGLLCQFCAFWQFFGQVFKMHTGSCRGQGRRWPYHGFIRSSNLAQTCDCCSIPISCPLCLVAG